MKRYLSVLQKLSQIPLWQQVAAEDYLYPLTANRGFALANAKDGDRICGRLCGSALYVLRCDGLKVGEDL